MLYRVLILLSFFLFFQTPCVFAASDLEVIDGLYHDGRAGEAGRVNDFSLRNNHLYVSWSDLGDGDFWLDVWDLANPKSPALVRSYSFGNINDDRGAIVPVAHLKLPRDMRVISDHLVFWSASSLYVYPLNADGTFGEESRFTFADSKNDGLSRLSYGGQWASTQRRLISNQEFSDLLNQGVPVNEISAALRGEVFLNLQNPKKPFFQGGKKPYGTNVFTLPSTISGSRNGHPIFSVLNSSKNKITTNYMNQVESTHIETFWISKLQSIFNFGNSQKTLLQLLNETTQERFIKKIQRKWFKRIQNKLKIRKRKKSRLFLKVKKRLRGNVTISQIVTEYGILEDDSIELALKKIIAFHLPKALLVKMDKDLSAKISSSWLKKILVSPKASLSSLEDSLSTVMGEELASEGVVSYLVDKILSPLIGNPAFMEKKLGEVLDSVTQTNFASAIDTALGTFDAVMPDGATQALWGFSTPQCFQIPDSSSELLNLALIARGPELNRDSLAFWEMLKLALYFSGNNSLLGLEAEIESSVRAYHATLSKAVVNAFAGFAGGVLSTDISPNNLLKDYMKSFSLESVISEILYDELAKVFTQSGIDLSMSVDDFFEGEGLTVNYSLRDISFNDSTGKDFLKLFNKYRKLKKYSLIKTFSRAAKQNTKIREELKNPLKDVILKIYGDISLDTTLSNALSHMVLSRLDPSITGDFVKSIVGEILNRMQNNVVWPSILNKASRAAKGDCIAQWQVALEISAAAASIGGAAPASAAFIAAEGALNEALSKSINYILNAMLEKFLDEIISSAAGSYSSWNTHLESNSSEFRIDQLTGRTTRIVDLAGFRNTLAVLQRNVGSSFVDPPGSKDLTLTLLDPLSPLSSAETSNIGRWNNVTAVLSSQDYLMLAGRREVGSSSVASVQVLSVDKSIRDMAVLEGDAAVSFSAAKKMEYMPEHKIFVVQGAFGKLHLIKK